jgi:hypothetical protein
MDEILKMALVPDKAEASFKEEPGEKKERPERVSLPLPV